MKCEGKVKIEVVEFTHGFKAVVNGVAIGLPESKFAAQMTAHDLRQAFRDIGFQVTLKGCEQL